MVLFIGFALFMDFYGKKIIMVSYCMTSYGWLMDGQAIYGWFYGYIVQSF
jgi:hypothetical protein